MEIDLFEYTQQGGRGGVTPSLYLFTTLGLMYVVSSEGQRTEAAVHICGKFYF